MGSVKVSSILKREGVLVLNMLWLLFGHGVTCWRRMEEFFYGKETIYFISKLIRESWNYSLIRKAVVCVSSFMRSFFFFDLYGFIRRYTDGIFLVTG